MLAQMFKFFNTILSLIFMIIKMSGVPNDLQKKRFKDNVVQY